MNHYKIAAVILNYKTWQDTVECVNSLLEMEYENYEIIIVENGSGNESYNKLIEKYSNTKSVHIVKSDKNIGFACGNNLGIKYARDKFNADFVYVANSDTIVTDGKLFSQIVDIYEKGIGVISPTVYKMDGSYHLPAINCQSIYRQAFRSFLEILYANLFYHIRENRKKKHMINAKADSMGKDSLPSWRKYVVHGCAYFLTPDFFEFYTGLYPRTFLYWEEINLLMYIEKAKLKSILAETSAVVHKVNGITGIIYEDKERERLKTSLSSGLKSVIMFLLPSKLIGIWYKI